MSTLDAVKLRPLPDQATRLLETLDAPPRLVAHLRLVHDVACELVEWLYPVLPFDRAAALFGAATHDIGKIVHRAELSGPGSEHEQAGYELLLAQGVQEDYARFARTHASWNSSDIRLEDLVVSLADKIWKAKRVPDLEQLIVNRIATAGGREKWQVFMELDDLLDRLAATADRRLAYQAEHPV
ncbi:HD domain-containing protein [Amycolatopsis xylanica]|uniref:HD domain-containing protein n=1 Tax=Amycolatopsis xylanica TaxID=589385 RepID=A0A1H3NRH3_9PSEU|nr:HD domain-containing protein [Amycolatopsis xylanica]SDY91492.1 HD domain-containing protein [Amycolatopsis xylanica]